MSAPKPLTVERHDFEHLVNEVNSLREQFAAARAHEVPRPTITKAVQNYIANTLQLNKDRSQVLRELISAVVVAELKPMVAGRFSVKVEPVVTVTEVRP